MSQDRILKVDLSRAIRLFERYLWKFYEVQGDDIRLEVQRNQENIVVNLPFETEDARHKAMRRLEAEGFIQIEMRPARG